MKQPVFLTRRAAPVALAAALLLAACGGDDPAKMLSSAKDYLQKQDRPAAIIQLKNALQAQPNLPEARFLLGQALLLSGDPVGAETELQKARDLGYGADEVTPLLVQSRLAQRQFRKVTDEFAKTQLGTPQANAELKTLIAMAWRQQQNLDAFQASLQEALAAKPDHAPALIEQARYKAAQSDFDGALAQLDALLANAPKNEDALKLRGDVLLHGKRDLVQALAAYQAAVTAQPQSVDAQAGVVRVLLGQGKVDEAAQAVDKLVATAPGRPQALYWQAQVALQKGDLKAAQTHAQQMLKLTPDNPTALELNGAVEYQLNAFVQAETLLAKAVQLAPGLQTARRLLVMTYLRTGQADLAVSALPADLATNDSDPGMLTVAGQAFMVKGDVDRAQQFFARAARLDPKDPTKRTSLALSQLMSGQTETALSELHQIAAADTGVVADMALINAHMQRREVDKALAAIATLEKKRVDDPLPWQLRGRALLLRDDRAAARKAFEKAQSINPDYFAATAALAALDVVDGKRDEAAKRLEAEVQRNPKNAPAFMGLAELRAGGGGSKDEVTALIQKAVDAAPTSGAPRVMLVDHHLRHNDTKTALTVAQTAAAALPDVSEVLDALGRAQSLSGEYNQAMSSFNKMLRLTPKAPLPYLRMATAQMANKDPAGATQSLRKALELQPDLLVAQRGLAELALQARQPAQAVEISRAVQKQRPKEAAGFLLEGDVHAASGLWGPAVEAYRNGLKVAPGSELAIKLHTALVRGGKATEAERMGAEWMKANPKDAAMPLYLGDQAIGAGHLPEAMRQYERVIALQPTNALALNNMAWVAGRLGRADAVALAERANVAAPNQPAFMDTLAMLLADKKDLTRAMALQKKAVELQPGAPVFKLNLARLQIQAGDKGAARVLLDELAALGDRFAGQAEVAELKKSL